MSDHEFRAVLDALGASRGTPSSSPPSVRSVAVLGAGPVGLALACEALAAGLDVRLHSVSGAELSTLVAAGGITVRGAHLIGGYRVAEGDADRGGALDGPAIRVERNVDDAIRDAEAVLVAVPAYAHATYAGLLAGSLADGQLVLLVPGRFLGSVALARSLAAHLSPAAVTLAELEAAPYVATADGASVVITGRAAALRVASLPVGAVDDVVARLAGLLPGLVATDGPLDVAFGAVTGVLTVAPLVTNTALVESGKAPLLKELLTPGLAGSLVARLDEERQEVAFRFGVRDLPSAADWLVRAYGDAEDRSAPGDRELVEVIGDLEVFDDLRVVDGPRVIDDVPNTLVPLASAGRLAGVPTPATDAVIALAGQLADTDFRTEGRSLTGLGLDATPAPEVRRTIASIDTDSRPNLWRRI